LLEPALELEETGAVEDVFRIVSTRGVEINVTAIPDGPQGVARSSIVASQGTLQEGSAFEIGPSFHKISAVREDLASVQDVFLRVLPVSRPGEFVGIEIDLHQPTAKPTPIGREGTGPETRGEPSLNEITGACLPSGLEHESPMRFS